MDDLISRKWLMECVDEGWIKFDTEKDTNTYIHLVRDIAPPAQPEISRIEQELHGKTPEEQYEFLYWLLLKFGRAYTDSKLAVVEWLRGEKEDG